MNTLEPALDDASEQVLARRDRRIGAILRECGKLTADNIRRILEVQKARGLRFGETAVRLGLIGVDDLRRAMARQYDLPHLLPESGRINRELVVAYSPFHPCAEQIRALRTQLLIRWANGSIRSRTLAIVSPGPREGRSYLAANLAVAFAQLGEPTLLIDTDLRKPRQHLIFNPAENTAGLSAVLSGRADRTAVAPIREFGTLSLLPAGAPAPNPLELLSRDTFTILLDELRRDFPVILLDTPAAQYCADAQTIAFRAGGALMVARKDHTSLTSTKRMIKVLNNSGATIAGSVLNAF